MNRRDIANLRLAMIRSLMDPSSLNLACLMDDLMPKMGELLAMADAFLRIKEGVNVLGDVSHPERALGRVTLQTVVQKAIADFEELARHANPRVDAST